MPNVCPKCDHVFATWIEYNAHKNANNCLSSAKPFKLWPTRTTTRTKAQIVADVESTWGENLI